MKKHTFLSMHFVAIALVSLLMASLGVGSVNQAFAGELFEPVNTQLTQSTIAPASRLFIAVDDETAVVANDRFIRRAGPVTSLFDVSERRAIAQWLMRAERRTPPGKRQPGFGKDRRVHHVEQDFAGGPWTLPIPSLPSHEN